VNIKLLKDHVSKPELYQQGNSVMWTDPHISKQLLDFHINPEIDIASRSKQKIREISNWIMKIAGKDNMNILDLGCGPGLYTEYFAKAGHKVTGIDFSNNSIDYAKNQAQDKNLNIEYFCKNYLELDYENQFDLVILIYMDFGALVPTDRNKLLVIINKALKKGGMFIFDVANDKNLDQKTLGQSWEVSKTGFWKDEPYIALNNGYHFPDAKVLCNHHIIVDENVKTYIFWTHYYTKSDLSPILKSNQFVNIKNYENILPPGDCWNGENVTFYSSIKE